MELIAKDLALAFNDLTYNCQIDPANISNEDILEALAAKVMELPIEQFYAKPERLVSEAMSKAYASLLPVGKISHCACRNTDCDYNHESDPDQITVTLSTGREVTMRQPQVKDNAYARRKATNSVEQVCHKLSAVTDLTYEEVYEGLLCDYELLNAAMTFLVRPPLNPAALTELSTSLLDIADNPGESCESAEKVSSSG